VPLPFSLENGFQFLFRSFQVHCVDGYLIGPTAIRQSDCLFTVKQFNFWFSCRLIRCQTVTLTWVVSEDAEF